MAKSKPAAKPAKKEPSGKKSLVNKFFELYLG